MGCVRKETCDFCDARCPDYMIEKSIQKIYIEVM